MSKFQQLFSRVALLPLIVFGLLLNTLPAFAGTSLARTVVKNANFAAQSIPAVANVLEQQTVTMSAVPTLTTPRVAHTKVQFFTRAVATSAENPAVPHYTSSFLAPQATAALVTPGAVHNFPGQTETAPIEPPDFALATSPSWVFQGVNDSFAVYDTSGNLQKGWPKASTAFFHVPNPGSCDPQNMAYMSDPRAGYDFNDHRFWVTMLELGGPPVDNCAFNSSFWIAVSQTADPRGNWNTYQLDMSLGQPYLVDFTRFGFDQHTVYIAGNMFDVQGNFKYAEVFSLNKSAMEGGKSVTAYGFYNLKYKNLVVDTVQPVESLDNNKAGLFVNSFDFNSNQCTSLCAGVIVWVMSNPGTKNAQLNGVGVSTLPYIQPPQADEPGCQACVAVNDTSISGTPVYHLGLLSFALSTGMTNSAKVTVPAILWGQVQLLFNSNGSLKGASIYQNGYIFYNGDGAAFFPTLMPDAKGNLFMVFDYSSSQFSPSVAYMARRVTDPTNHFPDAGYFLKTGIDPTAESRWGDYSGVSYDGFTTNTVWFGGQYSGVGGHWATYIGASHF